MRITILTDNTAGGKFLAEHGFSVLIGTGNEKVLFDTGHSDVFLKNARALGINLHREVNTIVLSHGHWDHGDGLKFLKNKTLITHPSAFMSRYRKSDHSPVGLSIPEQEIRHHFQVTTSAKPVMVIENLIYLGTIPRSSLFESQETPFEDEQGNDDFVPDDSALVAVTGKGLVVITGCAHAGICNICEHAKKITGVAKIEAVIGGFHLKHQNRQLSETIEYFTENQVNQLLPCHCTELPALAVFYENFGIRQVKTGMSFQFLSLYNSKSDISP